MTPVQRQSRRWLTDRPVLYGRPHGTRGTYVAGCRCDPCTDAEAYYHRSRYDAERRRADYLRSKAS